MNRKRKSSAKNRLHSSLDAPAENTQERQPANASVATESDKAAGSAVPSRLNRRVLTAFLVFHAVAIVSSMTAVVGSSESQARLNDLLRPYTMPTHFRTQGERVFLAGGEAIENPHQLQVLRDEPESSDWATIGAGGVRGLAVDDRTVRWIETLTTLVESESPSLVAELLLPLIRRDQTITAIRIVRLPTVLSLVPDTEPDEIYVAAVSRSSDAVSLIQIDEPRLRTMNIATDSVSGENSLPSISEPTVGDSDE